MFSDVIRELGDVNQECVSWIGQEQRWTIESLKVEIESLKSQLKERDEYIAVLEQSQAKLKQVENTVTDAVSRLGEVAKGDRRLNPTGKVDLNSQINAIVDIAQRGTPIEPNSDKTSSILASMLRGHVEFLTRLASTPDLQSLFLVSQNSGRTFLSEATKDLLLEQAARTSNFLKENGFNESKSSSPLGSVSDILDLKVDCDRRIDDIRKLVQGREISRDGMQALLLNEVSISNSLRRYAETRARKSGTDQGRSFEGSQQVRARKDLPVSDISNSRNRLVTEAGRRGAGVQDKQWLTWAKKLYRSLTGMAADFDSTALQMAIEEAALTSVGCPNWSSGGVRK